MIMILLGALGNAINWRGFSSNKTKMSRVGKTIRLAFAEILEILRGKRKNRKKNSAPVKLLLDRDNILSCTKLPFSLGIPPLNLL